MEILLRSLYPLYAFSFYSLYASLYMLPSLWKSFYVHCIFCMLPPASSCFLYGDLSTPTTFHMIMSMYAYVHAFLSGYVHMFSRSPFNVPDVRTKISLVEYADSNPRAD